MTFEMLQEVILTADVPEYGLRAGDVGTVVEHHTTPDDNQGYSVEFFDMTGRTITVVTLAASMLRAPTAADSPSVRVRRTG